MLQNALEWSTIIQNDSECIGMLKNAAKCARTQQDAQKMSVLLSVLPSVNRPSTFRPCPSVNCPSTVRPSVPRKDGTITRMTEPCEGKQLGLTKRTERLTTQTNVGDEIGNWMTKLGNSAGTLTQKDDVMTEGQTVCFLSRTHKFAN